MNKKFLSAILFGALMVSSTGTFVSCKDYDDDIDQINNTLNDLKSQIAALQTEVSNGNWVTSLTPTDGGFTVTFKDGKTYTIVNGKDGDKGETGEAGKDGNFVEVKDGYWYINGEKTDYVAVIKEDLGKALVPYVENGVWVEESVFCEKIRKDIACAHVSESRKKVVLGCTHYLYLEKFLSCKTYDGGRGVANRAKSVLIANYRKTRRGGNLFIVFSGKKSFIKYLTAFSDFDAYNRNKV